MDGGKIEFATSQLSLYSVSYILFVFQRLFIHTSLSITQTIRDLLFTSLFLADPVDCEYIETEQADSALLTVAYVMAGVCGLCLLPVFILLGQASCKRRATEAIPLSRDF